jgi:CheY-like chemotaxis protein
MPLPSHNLKIMIVEDDPDDQFMLKKIFSSLFSNVTIQLVDNGHACIEYLETNASELPQLITMDLNMPLMNGLETTAQIKNDPRFSHVPVVILSTSDRETDMNASAKGGADDYFIKNINYDDLKNTIKTLSEKWLKLN